jgi:hypothetical protein
VWVPSGGEKGAVSGIRQRRLKAPHVRAATHRTSHGIGYCLRSEARYVVGLNGVLESLELEWPRRFDVDEVADGRIRARGEQDLPAECVSTQTRARLTTVPVALDRAGIRPIARSERLIRRARPG